MQINSWNNDNASSQLRTIAIVLKDVKKFKNQIYFWIF